MNTPAPSAPVAATGTASRTGAAVAGKNKKHPGHGVSPALAKEPGKGSAFFAQLLSARAAVKAKTAIPIRMSSQSAASKEAAGLKAAVIVAIARSAVPTAGKTPVPARKPVSQASAASQKPDGKATAHSKEVSSSIANVAKKKTSSLDVTAVLMHAAAAGHGVPAVTGKEKKDIAADKNQAPVIEATKTVAHRMEPLIHVVDLRHQEKPSKEAASIRRLEPVPSQDRDAAMVVTRPPSPEAPVDTSWRPAPVAAPVAAPPLERLREMAGSELVRASQLVLRDGGGEIRLVLKPESLGSVRVRMNLVDKTIEGRIIVDSAAVKHVLDGSVDALRRALTAEGFQMGSLQVSVGGQDAQSDPRRQKDEAPTEVRRIAAQGFERSVPGAEDVSLGDLFVNLFV